MNFKKYYYIDSDGEVMEEVSVGLVKQDEIDKARKEFGNWFETERKAKEAQKKVKKLLKNL